MSELMSPELNDKLKRSYYIFEKDFIISTGDGWYNIIDILCRNITQHIDAERSKAGVTKNYAHFDMIKNIKVTEVKEKFGTLRFYCSNPDDKIDGMIQMAEAYSAKVCERCGQSGEIIRVRGWYQTLCDEHKMAEALGAPDSYLEK